MPYIPGDRREVIDAGVSKAVAALRILGATQGDVNYAVTTIALEALKPADGWGYHSLSSAIAALKDAAAEIERRLLGPYEDTAIKRNGDLRCYDEPFAIAPVDANAVVQAIRAELRRADRKDLREKE